jgi:hypothetical protein
MHKQRQEHKNQVSDQSNNIAAQAETERIKVNVHPEVRPALHAQQFA